MIVASSLMYFGYLKRSTPSSEQLGQATRGDNSAEDPDPVSYFVSLRAFTVLVKVLLLSELCLLCVGAN